MTSSDVEIFENDFFVFVFIDYLFDRGNGKSHLEPHELR